MASSSNPKPSSKKAKASPSDPKPKFPPEYYRANKTPEMMEFFEPNRSRKQEIDFNEYMYFAIIQLGGDVQDFDVVHHEMLQAIFVSPESPWEERLKDMVMVGDSGEVRLAFLPHCVDLYGKTDFPNLFNKLQSGNLEYKGMTKVVPKFLHKMVDPKPELKFEGPIYQLDRTPVELRKGCFTDALVVFHVDRVMSELDILVTKACLTEDPATRFHGIRLSPQTDLAERNLELGDVVIVWNGRHAGRPSFVQNFNKLVKLHNPISILVIEVRLYRADFIRLQDILDTNMDWGVDESVGLMGGITLFWDQSGVRGKTDAAVLNESTIRMLASIQPLNDEDEASSEDGSVSPEI